MQGLGKKKKKKALVFSLDFGFRSRSETEGVGNAILERAIRDSNDVYVVEELSKEAAPTCNLL